MIISDAKTAEAFRDEVLAEIERRSSVLFNRAARAKQRESWVLESQARELRDLGAFLTSIEIRPGAFDPPQAQPQARPGVAAFAAGYRVERRHEGWRVIAPNGETVRNEAHEGEQAAWLRADELAA